MPARVLAFAILNHSLDDEWIVPYLDHLVTSGYEGVCLHPRDGLLVPYNSRLYWEKIERIIELAKARGLEIWHYDEFPYPSGAIAGWLPQMHPGLQVRSLKFEQVVATPDRHGLIHLGSEPLLALLRYRLDDDWQLRDIKDVTDCTGPHFDTWIWGEWHNLYYTATSHVHRENHERGNADRSINVYKPETPLGDEKLLAIKLETVRGKKGWPGLPDITLPETTDLFLEKIYGKFAEISKRHGLHGAPVFQDEVTFYTQFPWNCEIEARLRPLWGKKLFVHLASLYTPRTPDWELRRYEYRTACQDALETNWYARVASYCHSKGLRMTGHLPGEESIGGHCVLLGDMFKNLRHFDIPGYDIISSTLPDDIDRGHATGAKLVQSVAWLEGRKPTMVEAFGACGFHLDPQKSRTMLAWLAAHDMTIVHDHSAYQSSLGVRKYDAPPVNNRFNPLSKANNALWDWHRWFCDKLREASFDPHTLVLFPVDALARYSHAENDLWDGQTKLLESFFHYLCAHSLDNIFIPSDRLDEIELVPQGFQLRGHTFQHLVVPPLHSLHQSTFERLQRLQHSNGFHWIFPVTDGRDTAETKITIFGEKYPKGLERHIEATDSHFCREADLIAAGSSWFDKVLGVQIEARAEASILKSRRRGKNGELTVLINPHNRPLDVEVSPDLGTPVPQPPNRIAVLADPNSTVLKLPARAIAVFNTAPDAPVVPRPSSSMLHPTRSSIRLTGPNHYSLKTGIAKFGDMEPVAFRAKPVSTLWPQSEHAPNLNSDFAGIAGSYSLTALPDAPLLEVIFEIDLVEPLEDLQIAIDEESLPPETTIYWDEQPLPMRTANLYDQSNTVFPIPPEYLSTGPHAIVIRAGVPNASLGVLEHPLVTGRFTVVNESPPTLSSQSDEFMAWEPNQTFTQLGLPEAYGPVDYEFVFDLSEEDAKNRWMVEIPQMIGVAQVSVNGQLQGQSAWEPRLVVIGIGALQAGKNTVSITLYGSWNNLFSRLNRVENGFAETLKLRSISIA